MAKKTMCQIVILYSSRNYSLLKQQYQQLIKFGADQITLISENEPCFLYYNKKITDAFSFKIECRLSPQFPIREYNTLLYLDKCVLRATIIPLAIKPLFEFILLAK